MRYWKTSASEIVDDFRYLLMRTARLASLLLFEVGLVLSFLQFFRYLKPVVFWDWAAVRWEMVALCFAAFVVCFCMSLATSVPYRYKSWKPGIHPRTCSKCGIHIADDWFCSGCKSFRVAKGFSLAILCASLIVTMAFVTHDTMAFALGTVMGGGSTK